MKLLTFSNYFLKFLFFMNVFFNYELREWARMESVLSKKYYSRSFALFVVNLFWLRLCRISILAGFLCFALGCEKQPDKRERLPDEIAPVFVTQVIASKPTPIPQARTQFKAGDSVTLTGLIMGVPDPFVEGRAAFVLGDEGTLTPCDLRDKDKCKTPWDLCCDPASVRQSGTATIQILDANGKPVRTGLKGVNDLKELSRVTVAGVVAANSSQDSFIVNATAIHIGVR